MQETATDAPASSLPGAAAETGEEQRVHAGAWRDNVEAMTMAIVMALLLKYFIVEAYKIPTGSMQPTLMGDERVGVFDRILVDKLSYTFRDPERFEVAVFRYPLDRSKNFVKRVVGLPGEDLRIHRGDLWTRADATEEWTILRRPRPVQSTTWKRVDREEPENSPWTAEGAGWSVSGRRIEARGPGAARFLAGQSSIRDDYRHGYPEALRDQILSRRGNSAENTVGDLRFEAVVTALADCRYVTLQLAEGSRRYLFRFPGPAAPEDARCEISVQSVGTPGSSTPVTVAATDDVRLGPGEPVGIAVQNLDDLLELEVGGELLVSAEVPSAADQSSFVALAQEGGGADFNDLRVFRDIYYLATQSETVSIPEGHYFMLGDNTQDSSDSREWTFVRFSVAPEDGEGEPLVLRGNHRQSENPRYLPGGPEGTLVELRDEWGERHEFPVGSGRKLPPERHPFVARDLILGRAVCVFWPVTPWRDVVRLGWVH